MEEIKPIKRSEELSPLSREHHDGLMFVWKLKQGLRTGITPERIRKYIIWFWKNHIKPHFHHEEKILLNFLDPEHELSERMKREHENIRELILNLDAETDASTISNLADLINDHIRFEERQLFNYLEEVLTKEQLKNIAEELDAHPLICNSDWQDKFWQ